MKVEIEVARNSTFCPGVQRAIKIVEAELSGSKKIIYTAGPIIHNPEVVKRLEFLGLRLLDPNKDQIPELHGATVIIRSHGIDLATEEKLKKGGAIVIDATCPNVKRAQEAAKALEDRGYHVIVVGSAKHPEVISIVGRLSRKATVIENPVQARKWICDNQELSKRVGIISQTTIPQDLFQSVVEAFREHQIELAVRDTRCESVSRRQNEALEMCKRVDLMIVIGGRNSSNTAKLAELCKDTGVETIHVEDPKEIERKTIAGFRRIGIIGGASTPDWQIEEGVKRIRSLAARQP